MFKICLNDYPVEKEIEKYHKFGYQNAEQFYLGSSKFNSSIFGWSGHKSKSNEHYDINGLINILSSNHNDSV